MRVLFAVSPGYDHLYPLSGLAWAFRTAGHDVVVATSGVSTQAAAHAGFAVREVSPGADFASIFPKVGSAQERTRAMRERGLAIAKTLETPDVILEKFSRVSDLMLDGTLEFATAWQPDLIVYSKLQGAALVTARALGIPAVEHGFSFLREGDMAERFLPYLAPLYERAGVPLELPSITSLYFAPEHMMHGEGEGWTMRSVPFHGGGTLPDWMARPKERPRVCVTLGTTVPHVAGIGSLESVLNAASEVDAEFVLALGDDPDLDALGTLPGNVRVVGWTPLSTLLTTCDGIIHHGGSGTTLTSAHAGCTPAGHAPRRRQLDQRRDDRALRTRPEPGPRGRRRAAAQDAPRRRGAARLHPRRCRLPGRAAGPRPDRAPAAGPARPEVTRR